MEQMGGKRRGVGGGGDGGGGGRGGRDRPYSIGGANTEEEKGGNAVKGREGGGGGGSGGDCSGEARAEQEEGSHGAKGREGASGGGGRGGKPQDRLVPAIPYTTPPPLARQARNYTVLNLNGTRIEVRDRWRRSVLDYRLWCYNNSDMRYELGHVNRRCCTLPPKGQFFIYMHYNGKWLCAVIDGPSGYLVGYITRSTGKVKDVRARENSEEGNFIEHATKLPYDGGYESVKLAKCGDLVPSFMVMYRHVENQEPAPLTVEVVRAGETFILHFTESGMNDQLYIHNIFKNFRADNPVGNKAYEDAREWKTSCAVVYSAFGIKDEEHGEAPKYMKHTDQSRRMTTEKTAEKAKKVLKDLRLLHRPKNKYGYFLLKHMPMQLSKDGPEDPAWAEKELRESHQLDLANANWEFLTEHFPEFSGTSIDGSTRKLVENAYLNTGDFVADKLVAYHESGHAIVALHTPGAHPIQKVTIVPQGFSLGMATQVAAQAASIGKRQILANLDVCLGGRVAQELIYGEQVVTAGAEKDLVTARELAHNMVSNHWISDIADEELPTAGEMKARIIAEEVAKLLEESYDRVKLLLKKHVDLLEVVANALVEKETLTADEMLKIVHQCNNFQGGEPQ